MSNLYVRITLGAFLTWLVPFVVSFALYNPETKIYLPSYVGFKIIMALIAAVVCYFTMRWISKNQRLTPFVPTAYVIINSMLDLILLVGAFKMPLAFWAATIFPIYVVLFAVMYLIAKR